MAYRIQIMKRIIAFVILVAVTIPAQAGDAPVRMITVSGYAEEKFSPDQAILSGSLMSRDRELNVAKQDNDKLVERVVGIAKEFKIPREKVSASNVYISPEYAYENNQQRFKGYVVNRQLSITIDEIGIHERVLSALIAAKVDQVNGAQFALADYESKAKEVRVKAVKNARQKAEALAAAAGAKLGPVISIAMAGVQQPVPIMRAGAVPMMADAAAEQVSVAPSLPGQITIQESVTVSFGLE